MVSAFQKIKAGLLDAIRHQREIKPKLDDNFFWGADWYRNGGLIRKGGVSHFHGVHGDE